MPLPEMHMVSVSEDVGSEVDGAVALVDTIPAQQQQQYLRKIICRYGRGCTHHDVAHKERFWHPPQPDISDEQLRTHYICNECGQASPSLQALQVHLQRKTAWSNNSLVGCRISCLVDYKEWHEAVVTQFHKSGKHFVEFRLIGERRWLTMRKIAFYIVERPPSYSPSSATGANANAEYKGSDDEGENDGLAPVDDAWVYCEDITLDYTFAQSVLFKAYGSVVQETGHKTKGHICLTDEDKDAAKSMRGSLLYGELLPRGANKAFGPKRLAAKDASVLFDLGMGTGKIAMQAFLQFRNLDYVYGIELSAGRYKLAEEAALRMVELLGKDTFDVQIRPGQSILITEVSPHEEGGGRALHLECGNMFEVSNMGLADIVMLETDIPLDLHPSLCALLGSMHDGARTLTYLDLRKIWGFAGPFPFAQLDSNRHLSDRFPTSWSVQRGHHFFLWRRIPAGSGSFGGSMGTGNRGDHLNPVYGSDDDGCSSIAASDVGSSRCLPFSFGISQFVGYALSRRGRGKGGGGGGVGGGGNGSSGSAVIGGAVSPRGRKDVEQATNSVEKVIPLNADGTRASSLPPLTVPAPLEEAGGNGEASPRRSPPPSATRPYAGFYARDHADWEAPSSQAPVVPSSPGKQPVKLNIPFSIASSSSAEVPFDSDTMHTPGHVRRGSGSREQQQGEGEEEGEGESTLNLTSSNIAMALQFDSVASETTTTTHQQGQGRSHSQAGCAVM